MPIAIDPSAELEYVVESDRESAKEDQTVFLLGALTVGDEAYIAAEMRKEQYMGGLAVLRRGLKGWRNFKDAAGAEVPFVADSKGRPTDESLSRIPLRVRLELSAVIQLGAQLTADDKGK